MPVHTSLYYYTWLALNGQKIFRGAGVVLRAGPLNYLFVHAGQRGSYCLGVFDNAHQGTLLGGITFRNVLVQARTSLLLPTSFFPLP